MFRGLYTAVSSMQTNQRMLDITSNNMANVNTTGFKKDVLVAETFPEVLIKKINGEIPNQTIKLNGNLDIDRDGEGYILSTERGFFTVEGPMGKSYSRDLKFTVDEDGYLRTYGRTSGGEIDWTEGNFVLSGQGTRIRVDNNNVQIDQRGRITAGGGPMDLIHRPAQDVIGTINGGKRFERTHVNFLQGTLEETGSPLNFAIDGTGFFRVQTPEGPMYTRNGSFSLGPNGNLVTAEGYLLLGQNGPINVGNQEFQVKENGQVIVAGQLVNQISMTDISNLNSLDKFGQSYYIVREGLEVEETPFTGEVLQGFLEGSNISTIDEMVKMISTMRSYEASSKMVKAYDEMLQKAVNDIGKL